MTGIAHCIGLNLQVGDGCAVKLQPANLCNLETLPLGMRNRTFTLRKKHEELKQRHLFRVHCCKVAEVDEGIAHSLTSTSRMAMAAR